MFEMKPTRLEASCPELETRLLDLQQTARGWIAVTEKTQFHAENFRWPDQPGDRGSLRVKGQSYPIINCILGAYNSAGELYLEHEIPVKVGSEGWVFVAAHLLECQPQVEIGQQVTLELDMAYLSRLSAAHTGCHLASLALNRALREYWRKDPGARDALGEIDFDRLAITESKIAELESLDRYRLGKSLRKKGFNSADALEQLPEITARINQQLNGWQAAEAKVWMEHAGEGLLDSRYWHCQLEGEPKAVIPCGGTHLRSLSEIKAMEVKLVAEESGFRMETQVVTVS
ncbi:alanyl-tRNA editing protein [Dongshaea marina]|uniref:hypothetical protein n=1 Tax=Dongshaea marina TaxID=2047966 RepID=UPI00131F2D85|nr:hypothetical protein [Dongshaea marina]